MRILKIYVDESGDFGMEKGSMLYTIGLTFYDTRIDISSDLKSLNNRFKKINYDGMVHTATLVRGNREYNHYNIKIRKEIFNIFYEFMRKVNVKYKSIVVDKRYCSALPVHKKHLRKELEEMIEKNKRDFDKFDKIVLYYDDGQKALTRILKSVFERFNIEIISDFNLKEEKLFQASDVITYTYRYEYMINKKMKLSDIDLYFFNEEEFNKKIKNINNKMLK